MERPSFGEAADLWRAFKTLGMVLVDQTVAATWGLSSDLNR